MGENGVYVLGVFIEASSETRDGKKADYILLATGGRKGAVSIKYDGNDSDFREVVDGLEMKDTVLCRVRLSAFKDSVYYSLLGITRGDTFMEAMEALRG